MTQANKLELVVAVDYGTTQIFSSAGSYYSCIIMFYVVRTVHFGMKLYNHQRNAQGFNLFIYLLLPYMFRSYIRPIFRGKCTTSAVVQVSWVWCQRPGADTISRRLELVH
jgi:hypothetical protein